MSENQKYIYVWIGNVEKINRNTFARHCIGMFNTLNMYTMFQFLLRSVKYIQTKDLNRILREVGESKKSTIRAAVDKFFREEQQCSSLSFKFTDTFLPILSEITTKNSNNNKHFLKTHNPPDI